MAMMSVDDFHPDTIANHVPSVYDIDDIIQSAVFRQVVLENPHRHCSNTFLVISYSDLLQKLLKMSMLDRTTTMIEGMNQIIKDKSSSRTETIAVLLLNCNRRLVQVFLQEFPYDLNFIVVVAAAAAMSDMSAIAIATTTFPTPTPRHRYHFPYSRYCHDCRHDHNPPAPTTAAVAVDAAAATTLSAAATTAAAFPTTRLLRGTILH